jgi:cytochrome c551
MKKSILSIVFGSALLLAACGGDDSNSSSNGETATPNGEKLVQQSCATCHGGKLQGAGAPALNQLGAKYTEEEILDIILNGKGKGMPPGLLKGEDAEAAAAYLAGLK